MKMTVGVIEPYRRRDGSWDVRQRKEKVDIQEEYLSRHSPLCAICKLPSYPECREWCPNGRDVEQR